MSHYLEEAWNVWKALHKKEYINEEEHQLRFRNWVNSHEFIEKHNTEEGLSYQLGHNKYSDLTQEEFTRFLKGFDSAQQARKHDSSKFSLQAVSLPDSVDWRQKGYVNPVQDQGQCGCCYAFSAIAAIEGQYFKKNGKLIKLSEQNAVDCSTKYGNNGGNGGTMDNVFMYVEKNGGIDSEDSYPYKAEAGSCRYEASKSLTTVSDFVDIPQDDESALTQAIATIGPISVGIDASQRSFQLYKSGIYNDPKCTHTPDHAVVAIGFGSEGEGKDFYLVRNSWGQSWGDNGYVKMARNNNNFAAIASMASYPIIGDNSSGSQTTAESGSICSMV